MRIAAALLAALGVFTTTIASGASFNCAKASTKAEKDICGLPLLSQLDSELDALYRRQLETDPAKSNDMRSEQRQWVRSVRNACQSPACMGDAYEARIAELRTAMKQRGINTRDIETHVLASPTASAGIPAPNPATAPVNVDAALAAEGYRHLFNDGAERHWWKRAPGKDKNGWRAAINTISRGGKRDQATPLFFKCASSEIGFPLDPQETSVQWAPIGAGSDMQKVLAFVCEGSGGQAIVAPTAATTAALASAALSSAPQERVWVHLRPNPNTSDDHWYIAPGTLTLHGNKRRAWAMKDQDLRGSWGQLSAAYRYEYDCARTSRRTVRIVYYKGNMGSGEHKVVSEAPTDLDWESGYESRNVPMPDVREACAMPIPQGTDVTIAERPPVQKYMPVQRQLDCATTSHSFDMRVCDTAELKRLDDQLSALTYQVALKSPEPNEVLADLQEWLYGKTPADRRVKPNCNNTCLSDAYRQRIARTGSPR